MASLLEDSDVAEGLHTRRSQYQKRSIMFRNRNVYEFNAKPYHDSGRPQLIKYILHSSTSIDAQSELHCGYYYGISGLQIRFMYEFSD